MEKQYSVFIQWHENTNNYRRFDGGLEVIGQDKNRVRAALFTEYENRFGGEALDNLFEEMGM